MARLSELTQELVDDAANKLQSQGKKPSPNGVRILLNTGSFSTIKRMLDIWAENLQQDVKIPVPEMPEFAHRFLEKLHRELYLQNYSELEQDREALEVTRQEFETERAEMLEEINTLEKNSTALEQRYTDIGLAHNATREVLSAAQLKVKEQSDTINQQQITLATLSEREKQLKVQIKDKDSLLQQAQKIEQSLQDSLSKLESKN